MKFSELKVGDVFQFHVSSTRYRKTCIYRYVYAHDTLGVDDYYTPEYTSVYPVIKERPTQLDQLSAGTHQKWAGAKDALERQPFDFDTYNSQLPGKR